MGDRGYFQIEGRWENTRNSPGEDAFFMIDQIGGSLDDAQRTAQAYIDKHTTSCQTKLEWGIGVNRKRQAYYAHTPFITFRITG